MRLRNLLPIAVSLALLFAGCSGPGQSSQSGQSQGQQTCTASDGNDPHVIGADLDAQTQYESDVHTVDANPTGPDAGQKLQGQVLIRYSPHCRVLWVVFKLILPLPKGHVPIYMEVKRRSDGWIINPNLWRPLDYSYAQYPTDMPHTDVSEVRKGCIQADYVWFVGPKQAPPWSTPCVSGPNGP